MQLTTVKIKKIMMNNFLLLRLFLLGVLLGQYSHVDAFAPVSTSKRKPWISPPDSTMSSSSLQAAATAASTENSGEMAAAVVSPKIQIRPPSSPVAPVVRSKKVISNSYGLWDLVIGPQASDFKLVQMPSELTGLAASIHKATFHLTRRARVIVLEALIRAYHAYRLSPSTKSMTVGAFMERIVSAAVKLGNSEVDEETIVACLLSQAPISLEEIEPEFGSGVGKILKGYRAMLRVENQLEIKHLLHDYAKKLWAEEGDNLRNLLVMVSKDWRSVALRVAWKSIEMDGPFRTKKEEIDACWAVLNIYASLAEKVGMNIIKNELEERAFKFLMPSEYKRIVGELQARSGQDQKVLGQARKEVLQALMEDEVLMNNVERIEVKGRLKSPYSIWKKTKARNCGIEDLHDVVALRVVCSASMDAKEDNSPEARGEKEKALCDYILSLVHRLRPHYQGRVKDFIRNPKPNGYQSLHTTLQMRLRGKSYPYEVQIRSQEMHSVAEHGLASHALYKGDTTLAHIIEKQKDNEVSKSFEKKGDFFNWCSRMLSASEVIVFDPDGRLMKLDRGATVLDFLKSYSKGLSGPSPISSKTSAASSSEATALAVLKNGRKKKKKHAAQIMINGQQAFLDRELSPGDVIGL